MSALARLYAAWLRWREARRADRPALPADWQQQLTEALDFNDGFRAVAALVDQWRDVRPGTDNQFEQWLTQAVHGCSCTASRMVIIHDPGTHCGDQQYQEIELDAQDASARAGGCGDDMWLISVAVEAVMNHLRDGRRG